jgi:hypothetical protein
MSTQSVDTPEIVTVPNCAVMKTELPGEAMMLSFVIPGVRRYDFLLNAEGRAVVAKLCQKVPTFGPGDMPRNNIGP